MKSGAQDRIIKERIKEGGLMDTRLNGPQQSAPSDAQSQEVAEEYENGLAPTDSPEKRVSVTIDRSENLNPSAAIKIDVKNLNFYYSAKQALFDVSLPIREYQTTALIGPSGCGKSTFLRTLNRMNDLIPGTRTQGEAILDEENICDGSTNVVLLRQRIGMVFQRPNPFPKSIFENVAYGLRVQGKSSSYINYRVEESLQDAALWDEVKDRLKTSALGLSGGQQQRLCIARAIAVNPEVLLMDEPCSALDPIATGRIEDLMTEIKLEYTIVIVTHNMQQAARISDRCAFFTTEVNETSDVRTGVLVECDHTEKIFANPSDERTENYVTGRFG